MILITSASYVNPELQVEFGKIPPAFLPLGAKRLYEHQVQLFKDRKENIVLSLPESYALNKGDQQKLKELDVSIVYVKDGLSLGQSIVYVLNMLMPIDTHLSILHGDTLYKQLENIVTVDNMKISKVNTSYDWEYVIQNGTSIVKSTQYCVDELREYVVSGYFNFTNAYEILKCITKSSYSFMDGVKLYAKRNNMELVKNNTWLDFGLAATYFHSRKSLTTERTFNSLKIEDGYVTKCSQKVGKLASEINWYRNIPSNVLLYIPRFEVVDDGKCYRTEYLYLNTLSELYVFGELPAYVWKRIFQSVKSFLEKLHLDINNTIDVNFNYKKKTLDRMKVFSTDNGIDLDHKWVYNGNEQVSINEMIYDLDKYIEAETTISFIHGDFCMSNIMYDFKSNEIKVYDPRGMDFEDSVTQYGKNEYDYAKFMHSVFGLYDFIISRFYTLSYEGYELSFQLSINEEILQRQEIYKEVFGVKSFKSLYAIMIHLFLSMLPLHNDDTQRQYALLANAFRLYKNLNEDN